MAHKRQIVLDTETTGLEWSQGHRLIELGCVVMENRQITAQKFHHYLNPQRKIDAGAQKVHGIKDAFLKDKPLFKDVLDDFLAFVDGAELIIHNAIFDVGFINHEFSLAGHPKTLAHHCKVTDTLSMARKLHPGQKNNLDALCKRYNVNNKHRNLHGALLDANILANVYLAMTGGQINLFEAAVSAQSHRTQAKSSPTNYTLPTTRATTEELEAHHQQTTMISKKSGKKALI